MRATEPNLEEQNSAFRYKHLKFLAALGTGTGFLLVPLLCVWDMPVSALCCLLYATYCATSMWLVGRYHGLTNYLLNAGVFFTVLITVGGILLQKPDVMVAHWVMTIPVIAYVLCSRKVAILWVAFAAFGLVVVHQIQPQNLTAASTLMLIAALAATSVGLDAFAKHIEQNERLIIQLGNTDSLTGALNRRSFHEVLQTETRRNFRQRSAMTVFMIDVDHFKKYNDRYGHVRGDEVLTRTSQVLKQTAKRSGDFVFRYGGEEFCILCSGLEREQAQMLAERLRTNVDALNIEHADSCNRKITVSVGCCHADSLGTLTGALTPEALVDIADKALYLAKANGRNRVESSFPSSVSAAVA